MKRLASAIGAKTSPRDTGYVEKDDYYAGLIGGKVSIVTLVGAGMSSSESIVIVS